MNNSLTDTTQTLTTQKNHQQLNTINKSPKDIKNKISFSKVDILISFIHSAFLSKNNQRFKKSLKTFSHHLRETIILKDVIHDLSHLDCDTKDGTKTNLAYMSILRKIFVRVKDQIFEEGDSAQQASSKEVLRTLNSYIQEISDLITKCPLEKKIELPSENLPCTFANFNANLNGSRKTPSKVPAQKFSSFTSAVSFTEEQRNIERNGEEATFSKLSCLPIMEEGFHSHSNCSPINVTQRIKKHKYKGKRKLRQSQTKEVDTLFTPVARNMRLQRGLSKMQEEDHTFVSSLMEDVTDLEDGENLKIDGMKNCSPHSRESDKSVKTVKINYGGDPKLTKATDNIDQAKDTLQLIKSDDTMVVAPVQNKTIRQKEFNLVQQRKIYKDFRRARGKSKSYSHPLMMMKEERREIREALRPKAEYHQRLTKIVELYHEDTEGSKKQLGRGRSATEGVIGLIFPELKSVQQNCQLI